MFEPESSHRKRGMMVSLSVHEGNEKALKDFESPLLFSDFSLIFVG